MTPLPSPPPIALLKLRRTDDFRRRLVDDALLPCDMTLSSLLLTGLNLAAAASKESFPAATSASLHWCMCRHLCQVHAEASVSPSACTGAVLTVAPKGKCLGLLHYTHILHELQSVLGRQAVCPACSMYSVLSLSSIVFNLHTTYKPLDGELDVRHSTEGWLSRPYDLTYHVCLHSMMLAYLAQCLPQDDVKGSQLS